MAVTWRCSETGAVLQAHAGADTLGGMMTRSHVTGSWLMLLSPRSGQAQASLSIEPRFGRGPLGGFVRRADRAQLAADVESVGT